MKIFVETYISLLICFVLYFSSSEHVFCYGRVGDNFRPITSLVQENEDSITQENYNSNSLNDYEVLINYIVFNVRNYGAKGDGATDDTEAFVKTWSAACNTNGGVMLVPAGYTFLLQTVTFDGISCQPNIVVQVDGTIVAPANKQQWIKTDFQWIQFKGNRKGITIKGNGLIDGRGSSWWVDESAVRPHAVKIVDSSNVVVTGIKIQNPPQMHIFIEGGQYLEIYDFTTLSPADSPNTDGIHITHFQHVNIHNCNLSCGDDCVSIQRGCFDVKVHDVYCGPGHGFSIGGLGPHNTEAEVSDISVFDSTAQNSMNGVRIKTWPGGSGYVRNITFSNIKMLDVQNAIVIDQYYCGGPKNCPVSGTNAIAISSITYEKLTGTFTGRSVSLQCSPYNPCKNLEVSGLNLVPSIKAAKVQDDPQCSNAYGKVLATSTPPLNNCLLPNGQPTMSSESTYIDLF